MEKNHHEDFGTPHIVEYPTIRAPIFKNFKHCVGFYANLTPNTIAS